MMQRFYLIGMVGLFMGRLIVLLGLALLPSVLPAQPTIAHGSLAKGDGEGKAPEVVLHQGGNDLTCKRIEGK
jgi:hypothetical protein